MKKKNDIFESLELLESERGIPVDFMLEKIQKAIITACKNSYDGNDEAIIKIDRQKGIFDVRLMKEVVEEVSCKGKEIAIADAIFIDPYAEIGDKVPVTLNTKEFGRIAAQTARNIIRQGIRDGEREQIFQEFQDKYHTIVTATVEKIDDRTGNATIKIGKAETVLPRSEQIASDELKEGDLVKVYISDVRETERGPKIMVSRTHADFVRKLIETEVPEVKEGIVEILNIARDAGIRTKVVVKSNDFNVDPVGACIGSKGNRIISIVNELGGEKVDVIAYKSNKADLVKACLAPAEVLDIYMLDSEEKSCVAVVQNEHFSLAIGNKGQNVRLAARITGMKIDIKTLESLTDEDIRGFEEALLNSKQAQSNEQSEDKENQDTQESLKEDITTNAEEETGTVEEEASNKADVEESSEE